MAPAVSSSYHLLSLPEPSGSGPAGAVRARAPSGTLERAYLVRLFRRVRGNIRAMTAALGIKRSNLYTWFRRVGLDVRELRRRL